MKAAFKRDDLDTAMQQVVLLCLANHANKGDDLAWPKVATIAQECRTTPKTVRAVLLELQQKGIIEEAGTGDNGATAWRVPIDETTVFGVPTYVKKESQRGKAPKPKKMPEREKTSLFKGKDFPTGKEVISLDYREKTSLQEEVTSPKREKTSLPTLSNQEATSKQPDSFATAAASPVVIELDALKEKIRHDWVSTIRNQFDALPAKAHIDANKEVRLAVEKFGQDGFACWRALVAGNHGDYLAPRLVSSNIGKWKAAGRPATYALFGRNGASNGPTGIQEVGGDAAGGNKYRAAAALEEAIRERARSQRTSVSA